MKIAMRAVLALASSAALLLGLSMSSSSMAQDKAGQTVGCIEFSLVVQPLLNIVCSDGELIEAALAYITAYQARLHTADDSKRRALLEQQVAFVKATIGTCNIAQLSNRPQSDRSKEIACLKYRYEAQRGELLKGMEGDALLEAGLNPALIKMIQESLQRGGMLPRDAKIDGIIGSATRKGIADWQERVGRAITGFASPAIIVSALTVSATDEALLQADSELLTKYRTYRTLMDDAVATRAGKAIPHWSQYHAFGGGKIHTNPTPTGFNLSTCTGPFALFGASSGESNEIDKLLLQLAAWMTVHKADLQLIGRQDLYYGNHLDFTSLRDFEAFVLWAIALKSSPVLAEWRAQQFGVPYSADATTDSVGRYGSAERLILRTDSGLSDLDGFDNPAWVGALRVLANQLNTNSFMLHDDEDRRRPTRPVFYVMTGCGAGETVLEFASDPPGAKIKIIPMFFYKLCELKAIDPLSDPKCDRWENVSESVAVSGWYVYTAAWDTGRTGVGRFDADKYAPEPDSKRRFVVKPN
jgi:hypothetical protein